MYLYIIKFKQKINMKKAKSFGSFLNEFYGKDVRWHLDGEEKKEAKKYFESFGTGAEYRRLWNEKNKLTDKEKREIDKLDLALVRMKNNE